MARTITITNGSTSISLLSVTGYQLLSDGWMQAEPTARTLHTESMFAEGRRPVLRSANNVSETFLVRLSGSSHDDLASQLQTLVRLARQAREYHMTNWQQTPVYLQAQLTGESNARYALIYDVVLEPQKSLYSPPVDPGNRVEELQIVVEREPYWRSHAPGTLPSAINLTSANIPETQVLLTEQVISSFRYVAAISKIYAYDDSAAAFSSDYSASTSFTWWEVAGSTPALNDCMYFGASSPFFALILNVGIAVVKNAGLAYEYWTGAAWAAVGASCDLNYTGLSSLVTSGKSNWAVTTINGQNLYWIRVRISSFTSWTTSPTQTGQLVYVPIDDYVQYANTAIDGDVDALALLQLKARESQYGLDTVVIGKKSRGLTNFTSRLNAGVSSQNPGSWTLSFGDDTSAVADGRAPGGYVAQCTFATTATSTYRVQISNSAEDEQVDWEGTYAVYVRAEQVGGSVGDVGISMQFGNTITTDVWYSSEVGQGAEIFPMGTISFYEFGHKSGETQSQPLVIYVYAQSSNGTVPDLNIFDVVFIPIDEWGIVVENNAGYTVSNTLFEIDAGVRRQEIALYKTYSKPVDDSVEGYMKIRGQLPHLTPSQQARLYALAWDFHGDGRSGGGWILGASVYPCERWVFLRGDE